MIPNKEQIVALHRKYASSDAHFELCFRHCEVVTEIAIWCVDTKKISIDKELIEAACLLHDIGAYMLMDDTGRIDRNYYQLHGIFASKILADEGISEDVCKLIETHQMPTIAADVIKQFNINLPNKDYTPVSVEAQLVCYADRFHSKVPAFNSKESIITKMFNFPEKRAAFESWLEKFGEPDIEVLAKKYGHPVK